MNWLRQSMSGLMDDSLAAIVVGLVVLLVGELTWNGLLRRMMKYSPDGKGLLAKLAGAVRWPGHLLIGLLAVDSGLHLSPLFKSRTAWISTCELLLQLNAVLLIGEALFAAGIGYYLRERRATEVPSIFEQLVKVVAYVIVGLSILSTAYRVDITPLLTTSAVFTMVIGLALQDVLGNLFSGLSVHFSPPFKIGDWIKVAGYMGKVVESNWRATTIRMTTRDLITLPNNDIAKKEIHNLMLRPGLLYRDFTIGLAYEASPDQVRKSLIGACSQVGGILKSPPPQIFMEQFGDFSISYRIRYWISDADYPPTIQDQLLSRIWYRLKRDGITIPFPIREVYTHPEKDLAGEMIERRLGLIQNVDFLADLERTDKSFIAEHIREQWYESGEEIVRKGDAGTDFYIIDRGAVGVYLGEKSGKSVATLRHGDFFGEMSLMTGEPRSATIVAEEETLLLTLTRETMSHLLHENAAVAKRLSESLAERMAYNKEAGARVAQETADGPARERLKRSAEEASVEIFDRIKRFFRLS
ncbi:MAG TPA: mechanosensitive ion channel [Candidatus Ozemobacteraceae bacterium]|nr:mechanosensitive ion channel [Candidatus Ozemobacteraceae bacterium]HQG28011.1 mechanosensitive ion channel [Candidatus Ozemobacteraceae bacterium]